MFIGRKGVQMVFKIYLLSLLLISFKNMLETLEKFESKYWKRVKSSTAEDRNSNENAYNFPRAIKSDHGV